MILSGSSRRLDLSFGTKIFQVSMSSVFRDLRQSTEMLFHDAARIQSISLLCWLSFCSTSTASAEIVK